MMSCTICLCSFYDVISILAAQVGKQEQNIAFSCGSSGLSLFSSPFILLLNRMILLYMLKRMQIVVINGLMRIAGVLPNQGVYFWINMLSCFGIDQCLFIFFIYIVQYVSSMCRHGVLM